MSRKATMEYIGQKRRLYLTKDRAGKSRILDEVCETCGFDRKYAGKLLTGNRIYKEPKGRGKHYSKRGSALLKRVWRASGCMCTKYLKSCIGDYLRDLSEVEHVDPAAAEEVAGMSASTMDRALRGVPRTGPGSTRRNRRSGPNPCASAFTCVTGEAEPACTLPPGHLQIDTVALCGGDMHDSFFWILTVTDKKTQWTEMLPVWNRGAEAVLGALEDILKRLPFKVLSIHCDNGSEFINAHLARYCREHPQIRFERSRPYRKNDNAHVEQKNGSVVRGLFGEGRIDDRSLGPALDKTCREMSAVFNLRTPCMMLTGRRKNLSGKGFSKRYDAPSAPAGRVLREDRIPERIHKSISRKMTEINAVQLRRKSLDRLSRIWARQKKFEENRKSGQSIPSGNTAVRNGTGERISSLPRRNDLALRATPPGPSYASGKGRKVRKTGAGVISRKRKHGVLANDE